VSRHNIDHDHEHGMIWLKALRPHKGYKYQGNYTEKQGRGKDRDPEGTRVHAEEATGFGARKAAKMQINLLL